MRLMDMTVLSLSMSALLVSFALLMALLSTLAFVAMSTLI